MNQLSDKELSGPHRLVLSYLRKNGISVVSEYPITVKGHTYRLDCFLPDYLVAVEVDGPQHSRKKDQTRDLALELVGVLTVRLALPIIESDVHLNLLAYEASVMKRRLPWSKRKEQE
jgi:very-short-patch-repair endonuclease